MSKWPRDMKEWQEEGNFFERWKGDWLSWKAGFGCQGDILQKLHLKTLRMQDLAILRRTG